jgi:hypothetical protein
MRFAAPVLAAALLATGAGAATITNLAGATAVDPTKSTDVVGGSFVLSPEIKSVSVSGVTRSPFEGTVNYGTNYFNIGRGGWATLELNGVKSVLTFLWGSPDSYNTVTLMLGAAIVDVLSLGDIPPPVTPGLNAFLVEISGGLFDKVIFASTNNALEFSNVAAVAPVPLPAGGLLLVGAFGGLAALRRRKRT